MKKFGTLSCMLVAMSALGLWSVGSAYAQRVPKTVLLEEGTNWSCGPCAADNPLVEAWLDSHSDNVIQIAYHPNWPGSDDPMYLNDPTDNQSRVVTYYGINGVPSVMVDGSTPNQPYEVDIMEQPYQASVAAMSPLKIMMDRSVLDTTVTVNIHITQVADLGTTSPLYLRVAAVERFYNHKGPNGEPRYINPMRQMMPSYEGTLIKPAMGQTQDFTFTYPLKKSYAFEKMYEVAFVQDDKSHSVLQAASTLEKFQIQPKSGETAVKRVDANGGVATLQIANTTGEDLAFKTEYLPTAGKDWTVTLTGAGAGTLNIANTQTGDVSLSVTPGTSAYAAGYVISSTITGRGDTISTSYPVKFISSTTKMAFVNLFDSASAVNTLKSMDALKLRYVPMTSQEVTDMSGWEEKQFSTIVMSAGKWIVTGDDKSRVANYLSSGGHLLLNGGEIAFGLADPASGPTDIDEAFLANTLHASYVRDSAGPKTVHGVDGDVVSSSFVSPAVNIYALSVDAPNQPDEIAATNGATPIFYYGTGQSQVAGLRWDDGNSKLVYLSFGLQNVGTVPRQAIIAAVLKWFGDLSGVEDATNPELVLGQNYPNPVFGNSSLSYEIPTSGMVNLSLTDVKGSTVRVLVDGIQSVGKHTISVDPTGLAKGTYFYTLHTNQGSLVRAMTIE